MPSADLALGGAPAGLLNAIGLQGIGVYRFVDEILPELCARRATVIVNVCGTTLEEYVEVSRVFSLLNISEAEAKLRFGFFLEALEYGTPPHGGIALGLDRIIAILAGETSIREVIAFPKTAKGADLMTDAPAPVAAKQLRDLYLELKVPKKE